MMKGSRLLVLPAVAVLVGGHSGAAQTPHPPFSIEDVDFTSACAPNGAFDRLLAVFIPVRPAAIEENPTLFDEPAFNAVAGDASHGLRLYREAAWHGLRLVEVHQDHGIESGPTNYTLAFADDPERVRAVWNERGWNLPPVGELREIVSDPVSVWIGVRAVGELATVTCFHD